MFLSVPLYIGLWGLMFVGNKKSRRTMTGVKPRILVAAFYF